MKRYKLFARDLSGFDLSLPGAFLLALSSLFLIIAPANVDGLRMSFLNPKIFFRQPIPVAQNWLHTKCGIRDNVSIYSILKRHFVNTHIFIIYRCLTFFFKVI